MIAFDFDNTIACYDAVFHRLALERGLIHADVACHKQAVRDALRATNQENSWTTLQGEAYGPRIVEAEPFPGAVALIHACDRENIPTAIVSHKTRYPYRGRRYDLHAAAQQWLKQHRLDQRPIYFEPTQQAKIDRIRAIGACGFVDDLPELLLDDSFPNHVVRYLFDPDCQCCDDGRYTRIEHWNDLSDLIRKGAA